MTTTTTTTPPPEPVVLPLNSASGGFIEDLASVPIDAEFREFLRHVSFDGFFSNSYQGFSEWLLQEPTSSDGGAAASSDYTTVMCETQGSEACSSSTLRC